MTDQFRTPLEFEMAQTMVDSAFIEASAGYEEGGIPVGAVLFDRDGVFLGAGRNRRVQDDDPATHAETDAFRSAGRRRDYSNVVMATTLSPCWYCCGLIKQFGIGAVVVGDSTNYFGGHEWLREQGVEVILVNDENCVELMKKFIDESPDLWNEDIGL